MNTSTLSIPTVAAVAATFERWARIAAPVICWAVAAVLTAAQIAYQLGHALGAAVHHRNDQLATLARRLATGERQAPVAPAPVAPVAPLAPVAPAGPTGPTGPSGPAGPIGPTRPLVGPTHFPSLLMTSCPPTVMEEGVMSPTTLFAKKA